MQNCEAVLYRICNPFLKKRGVWGEKQTRKRGTFKSLPQIRDIFLPRRPVLASASLFQTFVFLRAQRGYNVRCAKFDILHTYLYEHSNTIRVHCANRSYAHFVNMGRGVPPFFFRDILYSMNWLDAFLVILVCICALLYIFCVGVFIGLLTV